MTYIYNTLKTTDEVGCAKSNWRVSWLKSHRTRKLTHNSKSSATHLAPSQSVIVIEVTQRTTTTRLTSWLGKPKNLGSMLWVSECGPSRTLRITFALHSYTATIIPLKRTNVILVNTSGSHSLHTKLKTHYSGLGTATIIHY